MVIYKMIRKAEEKDISALAILLRAMYFELFPDYAIMDINVYITETVKIFNDPKSVIYTTDGYRGFFHVRDETEPMTPEMKRYNGVRVYIREEFRNSKLLYNFYKRLFKDFPDGDIIGVTEIHSKHIPVMNKRHKRIANMYSLNRGTK